MLYVLAVLGLGLLMVVHEGGHFLLARIFKMRVVKFSIGFGPVFWSKKPEGSPTTYQIALLPFLAYVQVAGMNPHEEIDPDDKESYANASWLGRFLTIVAGPAANYLFAVLIFFFLLLVAGRPDIDGLKVGAVEPNGAAAAAQVRVGDEVRSIAGKPVADWRELKEAIQAHKGVDTEVVVVRDGVPLVLHMTPSKDEGKVGVAAKWVRRSVPALEATRDALVLPPKMAASFVAGFGRLIMGREKPDLRGPIGIVELAHSELKRSVEDGVEFLAALSIYICVFNLIPFPALDGGRLAFLLYELVARRRPDAKVEARVHMVGLLTLLTIMVPLFFYEIWLRAAKLFIKG